MDLRYKCKTRNYKNPRGEHNCCFLIGAQVSQETRKAVWHSHLFKNFSPFVMIHTVKGFSIDNEAELIFFSLKFYCFFYDSPDVGNFISGSSAFSKCNWYFWKYSIDILLKPIWEDFENEHLSILLFTLNILCHCPSLGLERKLTFSSASMVIHSFLQGIFPNRNWTRVSCIVGRFFTP